MKKVLRRSSNDSSNNSTNSSSSFTVRTVRYVECQKNHAASVGGYVVDGCQDFMPGKTAGAALTCAACGCHRNFHRKEVETDHAASDSPSASSTPT